MLMKIKTKSFYDWCVDNNRYDLLDRWDYELNSENPFDVYKSTHKKYYFKCPVNLHPSRLIKLKQIGIDKNNFVKCDYCNSFAQWGINNLGNDFLEKYWDHDKNTVDPWKIPKGHNGYVWIKCQEKSYHKSYNTQCNSFVIGNRCPYCCNMHGKVHPKDSLGRLLEDKNLLHLWSNKNKKSPYEYTPKSSEYVWFKCVDGIHKDYLRNIGNSNSFNFRCPECVRERTESLLQEKVRKYINKQHNYALLHEYNCSIIPRNPKRNIRNMMPFDNEIVELKLIIEVHGIQHYELNGWHILTSKNNNTTPEYEFHYQKLKDRYKRFIAFKQGYFYLEIPYWTEKDESYKALIDDKINEILNKNLEKSA